MSAANTLHLRPLHPWIKDARVDLYYVGARVFQVVEYWTPGCSGRHDERHIQLFCSTPSEPMRLVAIFSDGRIYVDGKMVSEPGDPSDGKHAIDMFLFWEVTRA